jgi:hypothetical protein
MGQAQDLQIVATARYVLQESILYLLELTAAQIVKTALLEPMVQAQVFLVPPNASSVLRGVSPLLQALYFLQPVRIAWQAPMAQASVFLTL